jgi:hypothetical protein
LGVRDEHCKTYQLKIHESVFFFSFLERCRHNTTFLLPRKSRISVEKISRSMIMDTMAAYFEKQQKTLERRLQEKCRVYERN